jgi:hypothetical protein
VDRVESRDEILRPVVHDDGQRDAVCDGKREVEIGPAVAFVERQGSDDGAGDDAIVGLGQREDVIADTVAILDREHRYLGSAWRLR